MSTEHEQGTFIGNPVRRNGYYAGDFSHRPFPTQEHLNQLMRVRLPVSAGRLAGAHPTRRSGDG